MPSITTKNYTTAQVTKIKAAFGSDEAPATDEQVQEAIEAFIRGKVDQKAWRAAANVSVAGF
jgi:hypothetical protein